MGATYRVVLVKGQVRHVNDLFYTCHLCGNLLFHSPTDKQKKEKSVPEELSETLWHYYLIIYYNLSVRVVLL